MLDVSSEHATTTTSNLNLMPLLDVMLLLLIFFLLASSFMRPSLQVDLPRAATSRVTPQRQQQITVSLTQDGQIAVDTVPVSLAQLKSQLTSALVQDRERPIRLQADKGSAFGRFIAVMDAAKEAGAKQLIIETTTGAEERRNDQ